MNFLAPIIPFLEAGDGYLMMIAGLFARVSAIVFLSPGIGERAVPVRVRLAAAFAFTMILAPLVVTQSAPPSLVDPLPSLAEVLTAETLNGLVFGFGLRLFLFTLQIAGSIIAQHVSLSQLFGPTVGFDSESPYAAILTMSGIAIAVTANLHIHVAGALAMTYEALPFAQFPTGEFVSAWSAHRTGRALNAALALAAPFVVIGFVYSLALAAASRAMPQLMAAFVGAPAITMAGMGLFAISAPMILITWRSSIVDGLFGLFGIGR